MLLMGDFNSVPSEDEHPEFSKNESYDVWMKLEKGNPGYTFDTKIVRVIVQKY